MFEIRGSIFHVEDPSVGHDGYLTHTAPAIASLVLLRICAVLANIIWTTPQMASHTDDLKGYDCQFVDPIPDSLTCLICTLLARDPQQTVCCGKVYCRVCLSELKESFSDTKCPQCRKKINSFPDTRGTINEHLFTMVLTLIDNITDCITSLYYLITPKGITSLRGLPIGQ